MQREGVFGLWRGVTAGIPRLVVGSATQLTTYSQVRVNERGISPILNPLSPLFLLP